MTNTPELPPPAWYPDPADPARERWWSGQGWTDHLRDSTPIAHQQIVPTYATAEYLQPIAPAAPTFPAATTGYVPLGGSYSYSPALTTPATGSPHTVPVWLLVLSPLVVVAMIAILAATGLPTAVVAIGGALGVIFFLIAMVYWDGVILQRRNLPTPSALWLLLSLVGIALGLIAYLIARSVALSGAGRPCISPILVFGGWIIVGIGTSIVVPILLR